jgi:polysaccharide biosynthesis transport protein
MNAQLPRSDRPFPPAIVGHDEPEFYGFGNLPPQIEGPQDDLRASLVNYLALAVKRKYFLTIILMTFLVGGLIITLNTSKIYSASSTIRIERSAPRVIRDQLAQQDSADGEDTQFYETQFELIRSRVLADRVATALNLEHTDFLDAPQTSFVDRLKDHLGPWQSSLVSRFTDLLRAAQRSLPPWLTDFLRSLSLRTAGTGRGLAVTTELDGNVDKARHERAVSQIMDGLSVKPIGDSSIVRISYAAGSPAWAQRISIAVAEQFEKMTLDMRFSASLYARNFLEERLQELKHKLEASERQLIDYAHKEGILDVDSKQPQVLTEIAAVENAYAAAATARLTLEETWRQAQGDGGDALPQIMGDAQIQAARAKLAELRGRNEDKLTIAGPASPAIMALRAQISETEADIRNQISLIKASIKDQYNAAVANEKALADELASLKTAAIDLRGRSVDYAMLSREVDTNRVLYDGLLQQYQQLTIASNAETNNISVVDRALLPSVPVSPSLSRNLLLALVLGLVAATGAVWLIELLDDTFKSPEDIENRLGVPVLGVIPNTQKPTLLALMHNVTSPLAESYRSLRTAIRFSTLKGAPRSLLITSSRPGEGNSTITASIALNFGQLGRRVLLIDGNLRDPSIHHLLGIDNRVGLSTYLSSANCPDMSQVLSDAWASGAIKETAMTGVAVMTAGPVPPNPAELLAGPKLSLLLTAAGEFFDSIIIDGPPVMGLADVPTLSSAVEGVIMVIESAEARRTVVRQALKRLQFARARVVGAVLNKYHPRHAPGLRTRISGVYEFRRG